MEISAPADWDTVDFLSDLHLDRADSPTLQGFAHYLQHSPAQAIFILGDLFEAWVGDDALDVHAGVEQAVAALLQQTSQRAAIFILCGNRDFLMGPRLMQACRAQALPDPSVLEFSKHRFLLTHGDAFCLGDTDYLAFRRLARSEAWQQDFLNKPLAARQALGQQMRAQSMAHQAAMRQRAGASWHDLDTPACLQSLKVARADTMIHGHTHRPNTHPLAAGKTRWVLSDWDFECSPPRGDLLRLTHPTSGSASHAQGPVLQRLRAPQFNV